MIYFAERSKPGGCHGGDQGREPSVRLLAVIGFCAAAIVCVYHLPLSWFNMMGDSIADLPSYMLPG